MINDIEQRLAKLEAVEDIKRLKISYASACDAGYDPALLGPLFTDDAVWTDITGRFGTSVGRDAICEKFATSPFSWALHYTIAPSISVSDDIQSATGRWYLWQPCTLNEHAILIAGIYNEEYRRDEGEWRISRLELTPHMASPYEAGWVKQPFIG